MLSPRFIPMSQEALPSHLWWCLSLVLGGRLLIHHVLSADTCLIGSWFLRNRSRWSSRHLMGTYSLAFPREAKDGHPSVEDPVASSSWQIQGLRGLSQPSLCLHPMSRCFSHPIPTTLPLCFLVEHLHLTSLPRMSLSASPDLAKKFPHSS